MSTPTRHYEVLESPDERLEVHVPDPRDVASVSDFVVESNDGQTRWLGGGERANDLVRAGRVLDQEHEDVPIAGGNPLEPAEGGAEA